MKVRTVCVGRPQTITYRDFNLTTSIFKNPVTHPVKVSHLNIEGDEQADLRVHGGPDKAVYAYSANAYEWWKEYDVRYAELSDGAFGENLTLTDCLDREIYVGDTFQVGSCILQVAQPRMPCVKLTAKFNDPRMQKKFLDSQWPGVYFRVLKEGVLQVGDDLKLIKQESTKVSVVELFDLVRGETLLPKRASEILSVPSLALSMRELVRARTL